MKQLFIILLFTVILVSCNKKTIQLPESDNKDITEILDISPVYLFYDETKPNSIGFNRKNMISTTNWLVNIDKRLSLKQVLPHLQYLQKKRHKSGLHKNENAKNYFTCFNPEIQNLAFIEFTDVVYHEETSYNYFKNSENQFKKDQIISINVHLLDSIKIEFFNNKDSSILKTNKEGLLKDIKPALMNERKVIILLDFNKNLLFQDYITLKSLLLHLDLNNVTIANEEFIYN